jgi:hypothetical protein
MRGWGDHDKCTFKMLTTNSQKVERNRGEFGERNFYHNEPT